MAEATFQIFSLVSVGTFDPCNTTELLTPSPPISFFDGGMTCRLANNSGADCWDATYTLSVPTSTDDLIAACLANLSLIDLNAVPFGTQRRVVNDPLNGSPIFGDALIGAGEPLPDACGNFAATTLAASFVLRYGGVGAVSHCTSDDVRRIQMPVYDLVVSASRSRFNATGSWCKRTREPVLIDPDFSTICFSQPGSCLDTCVHHQSAAGIIEVPALNSSVHIGLCTNPVAPCNPTPIPFV